MHGSEQDLNTEELNGEDSDRDQDFEWCLVGNIVDRHYFGETKEIRRGTKHFGPNTRVYCFPEFPGCGDEVIRVIGKPRRSLRMIDVAIRCKLVKNFRVKTYKTKNFNS